MAKIKLLQNKQDSILKTIQKINNLYFKLLKHQKFSSRGQLPIWIHMRILFPNFIIAHINPKLFSKLDEYLQHKNWLFWIDFEQFPLKVQKNISYVLFLFHISVQLNLNYMK